ncbi:bifunctional phosphoribosyl-AMP cyclohydrolase/phosphoribosyl-ATP diphosphatase HisIE [Pantoea sp. Aalb]|uniref:bifunctional phosphoribosyl-AMP cyclohydrolase/phosphoribosyl-ATP diphosphatase HisIE n=1 Tax=Pantoea sp. Aalb TaxID=2576762 RepID=UPI00132A1550|nr:bifunctional phosphoribosyl-AMP cyclohydrolase/phosphoribosyl-ATP diphosphatase HisIE [Pantoea sp. Aalb]MXP67332.1 bifunctional phosphoribosyl-AMP cyclohydrolase/phosphoribosyl-ATP diphosphatase HisIE [Pantoea sp. Aalb]
MLTIEQLDQLDWEKTSGMIPAIVQHHISGEILMHGYMNHKALHKTLTEKKVTFYSRTKKCLWTKGETSGCFLNLIDIASDCDKDTLLILVKPFGPSCHIGQSSCFSFIAPDGIFLYKLEQLLVKRKYVDPIKSYTAKLYNSGTKRIAQKVGEEGIETVLAAVVNNRHELINEVSDLIYHLIVLLQDQNIDFNIIINNLRNRHIS